MRQKTLGWHLMGCCQPGTGTFGHQNASLDSIVGKTSRGAVGTSDRIVIFSLVKAFPA
jgi:hypothetical protein